MYRKYFPIIAMFMVLTIILTACGGGTGTVETVVETVIVEVPADAAPVETEILSRVLERGKIVCGGRTDLAGFGMLDEAGNNMGFDIDFCRAVAAAVFGDPAAVEVVPLTAADRGPVPSDR